MPAAFPLFLTLSGQTVLIVGGGELALRKARLVAGAGGDGRGARLVVVAPEVHPDLGVLAAEVRRRPFAAHDLDGVTLVFAAGEGEDEAAQVADLARARGLLVNVPDRPALSTFIMPAIVDRGPVTVAISTGGTSPVLARRLRARVEAALEPGLGRLATFLDGFRTAVRTVKSDETARRRFWERVIDGPIAQRFLAGDEAGAHEQLVKSLNAGDAAGDAAEGGAVALVGAGPGDPDLLTLRALRVLQNADVVVHDKLVDDRILDYVRRDARRVYVGKSKSCHTVSQDEINALLVREAQAGHRVVRLKGGDPFIFGRGGEEMAVLRAAGVAVELVPGITAAVGCAAATGIPLTHRGLAQGITLVTAHGAAHGGQGDGSPSEPVIDWTALARLDHTLAIYMGLSKASLVADRLIAAGKAPGTPVAVIENGTRPDQTLIVGSLDRLGALAAGLTGPALILVGEVVTLADPAKVATDILTTLPVPGRDADIPPGTGFKAAV
ncbi:uroporphyrin-III C-methyltransferase/precorrin-2 dehydrogenase/sirohydrochlorin ferrochelatase [Nitrospirillum amazonense]|uniref:Uroporphyrin-III C-methyltransferase/precorrin-2 dehydrogenase/sirohydrochlorin ferrochelatase n=1 Tax=Nitrospirillum amazonense TaxID=28077 RepID=A0A560FGR8_9PROT|nr:siroheme synthase CysG [Nitrospirillum amazonense]TWB20797.1 uroporphyrin-III C-methyltransferase/precorrin-2 dehydrogenase/sirohydrochlorin ferrochelatase [Nitrospirillum amazonense]